MKLLDHYIAKTVLSSMGLVILMLAGLQLFILFVDQLDNMGKGDYGIVQATTFVLLQMPYQMYLFLPMASLLGGLIGLSVMANHHELVVMRAAGMSIGQITWAVMKAALIVIIIATAVSETFVPHLVRMSQVMRMHALSGEQSLQTSKGIWMRHQNDFLNIGLVESDHTLADVYQFHFDSAHRLRVARKISRLDYTDLDKLWHAHHVDETIINQNATKAKHIPEMVWDVSLKPSFIGVLGNQPDEMGLPELYRYLHAQKINHQTALNYQLVFWQRLITPMTTLVMMLLAIPFIFGPLRSSGMGSKLLLGASLGFGFHMINRFLGSLSQVYQFSPVLAAIAPTCLFALLGLYLMRGVK